MSLATLLELFKPHTAPPVPETKRPPITPATPAPVKVGPWRNWHAILMGCGCTMQTVSKWEMAFQNQMAPDTLNDAALAHFLGQCLHETSMFLRLQEDLSYTADRMMQVWPHRFPNVESTTGLTMNPRALAERVYGGRLGNDLLGDGFAYRGRGFPMITGKDNYEALQAETGDPLVDFPDLLLTPDVALRCGLVWFSRNISGTIESVEDVTQIVNGGQTGIEDRRRLTAAAQRALLANPWK